MSKTVTLLGISGSLRKQSYNNSLLVAAKELLPAHCKLIIADLSELPCYNQDLENPLPPSVERLKQQIKEANGVLLATPEYNYSMSGLMKNVLDWVSRPYGNNTWDGKPVALMGASMGLQGTSRAQYHMRQVFVALNIKTFNRPELMISAASDKFDGEGKLQDPKTRQKLQEFLTGFLQFLN